jgi:multicomponent Na+:H+ antiporter subunit A
MLVVLIAFTIATAAAWPLTRALGPRAFPILALVPAASFVWFALQAPTMVAGGEIVESVQWIPQLQVAIGLRLDALSWTLALVASGIGALVLLYCTRYFTSTEPALPRFAAVFTAFAGAMVGLVLSDDVAVLFVFWEATTVLSYLLISHRTSSKTSRGAALQALLVTTLGGLAMLVGLVLLSAEVGSTSLAVIVAEAPAGPLATTAVMLVLAGAVSKSAIFPFHFWLPAAMAAPTPVSAYLHAAAMVKAGIFLIGRMAPGFAEMPGWRETLIVLGIITMLLGGWQSLRQNDIKLVLAHGTVSQLGLLAVIIGFGTQEAALAGLAMLTAHALAKAALFLVVGIVDHRTGTRDLRKLSGLGRQAPILAITAALAIASMVGLPPTFGFVAKEAALAALLDAGEAGMVWGWVALIGIALGSVLTVAYGIRFWWGAFARKRGVAEVPDVAEHADMLASPSILALTGLGLGFAAPLVDTWVAPYAATLPPVLDHASHLALWHGFTVPLGISLAIIGLGAALAALVIRSPLAPAIAAWAQDAYTGTLHAVDRVAARTTALTQRGSLPFYLAVILGVLIIGVSTALSLNRTWPTGVRLFDSPAQLVVGAIMIAAAIATVRATKRFQAAMLVGVTGYGMSALFAMQGAPDLALTQILIELVTIVAVVLVLRRLPARLGEANGSRRPILRAAIGIGFGAVMAVVAVVALGARTATPISVEWARLAKEIGHGSNVVNVALVDLRGWDTMGELSVLVAAATGVASLLFLSSRDDTLPRVGRLAAIRTGRERFARGADPATDDRGSWLLAGRTLDARNRSILLEVVVRLLFHALIVLSIYVLLVGHNLPGGGFAGGLIAGMALVARYLAGGRHELGEAAPFGAGVLLGVGMLFAAGTALAPLFVGADALTSAWFTVDLGPIGSFDFVTSTLFDIGVYLVVIGLVLDVLRSLGGEVDRLDEGSTRRVDARSSSGSGAIA